MIVVSAMLIWPIVPVRPISLLGFTILKRLIRFNCFKLILFWWYKLWCYAKLFNAMLSSIDQFRQLMGQWKFFVFLLESIPVDCCWSLNIILSVFSCSTFCVCVCVLISVKTRHSESIWVAQLWLQSSSFVVFNSNDFTVDQ